MFQNKTVSTVLAGFNKVIDDLKDVAERNEARSAVIDADISQLLVEQGTCLTEVRNADAVRLNIMKMLGGDDA